MPEYSLPSGHRPVLIAPPESNFWLRQLMRLPFEPWKPWEMNKELSASLDPLAKTLLSPTSDQAVEIAHEILRKYVGALWDQRLVNILLDHNQEIKTFARSGDQYVISTAWWAAKLGNLLYPWDGKYSTALEDLMGALLYLQTVYALEQL